MAVAEWGFPGALCWSSSVHGPAAQAQMAAWETRRAAPAGGSGCAESPALQRSGCGFMGAQVVPRPRKSFVSGRKQEACDTADPGDRCCAGRRASSSLQRQVPAQKQGPAGGGRPPAEDRLWAQAPGRPPAQGRAPGPETKAGRAWSAWVARPDTESLGISTHVPAFQPLSPEKVTGTPLPLEAPAT